MHTCVHVVCLCLRKGDVGKEALSVFVCMGVFKAVCVEEIILEINLNSVSMSHEWMCVKTKACVAVQTSYHLFVCCIFSANHTWNFSD